jgi:hypothetical protein
MPVGAFRKEEVILPEPGTWKAEQTEMLISNNRMIDLIVYLTPSSCYRREKSWD